jgi:PAS domain S-box-containing protein
MTFTFVSPIYLVPPLVAFILGLSLALVVLNRDPKSTSNRLFSLVLVGLSLWGLFIFFMRASPNTEYALFWDRFAIPCGIAMFVLYYHFTSVYTGLANAKAVKAAYGLMATAITLSATGLIVSHMEIHSYGYAPIMLPAMYAVTAGGALAMIGALINLIRAMRVARHHEHRARLQYMITAIILLFSFGILDMFPGLPPFGIFGNIVFGSLTAVAILKYHLLDINIVIRKGLKYLLISAIVAIPYIATGYYFRWVQGQPVPVSILVALLIFTALTFNPLWRRVERFVDRRFYRKRYDFLKLLERFSNESHDISDVRKLSMSLVKLISQALEVPNIRLLLPDESGRFSTVASAVEDAIPYSMDGDNPILKFLRSRKAPLYHHEIDNLSRFAMLMPQERNIIDIADAELFLPLTDRKSQLVGLLVLGKKPRNQPYSYDDERTVIQVADRIAIELENAQLYEQIRQSEMALRESETLFRTIVEASPSFLMIVDIGGNVIYASPNCEQYTGYTPIELQGKVTWWVHDSDLARITESFRDAFQEGLSGGSNVDFRAVKKNGEEWFASASWRLLRDWKEEVKALVVQVTDVTDRRRMEKERSEIQQKAYVSSRLASVGEMAAGIAHEINNPLTAVIGFSQILMKRNVPEDIKKNLEIVNNSAQRVAAIIRRLLMFARQQKPKRGFIDVNKLLMETLALRTYELETNNIQLMTELDSDLPEIVADGGQLQQVFLNIIMNAETEMRLAHGKGNMLISTEAMNGRVLIRFKDDGPGIAPDNVDRIFDPFFTTREVGQGTGLGLSLCHGIVTEHDGRIYVESTLGQGATFIIELPVAKEAFKTEPFESLSSEIHTEKSHKKRRAKILVVDDEESILQLLSRTLFEEGYLVETVDSGEEALERIEARNYDLVIIDIKLPGMSGFELYERIKEANLSKAGEVLFMTGDLLDQGTKDFLLNTKKPYIAKPFDYELMKEEIIEVINGHKQRTRG